MNRKNVLMVVAMMLVVAMVSVGATFAFLTAKTEKVTNTFTAGNVSFNDTLNGGLDEAKTNEYGVAVTPAERVTANEYKLVPGHNYKKDPTVHMSATTEPAWLFVKVENGIVDIEANAEGVDTIAEQMADKGWSLVAGTTNVYAYEDIVKAGENIVVFESFTLKGDANVADYAAAEITIQAYAVQADTFDSAAAAWAADPAEWD